LPAIAFTILTVFLTVLETEWRRSLFKLLRFLSRKWLWPAVMRMTLPPLERRRRLAVPLCVFIFGILASLFLLCLKASSTAWVKCSSSNNCKVGNRKTSLHCIWQTYKNGLAPVLC